jgi:hypothetical protein
MIKLSEMISRRLFIENKKLRVFDFDDTIVTTNSFVYVIGKDGRERKLSPGQFAVYEPKAGEQFDFRDFTTIKEPTVIKGYFELLKRFVNTPGTREVFILTARSAYKPIKDFLRDSGIKNVYVVALGSSNPEHKADWIEDKIKTGEYNDVYFIDDSIKNVNAVKTRLQSYPNIKSRVQHIKHG